MKKTIVIYGSTTGTCQSLAKTIAKQLEATVVDVCKVTKEAIEENEAIIIGSSTWGYGDLQDDWYDGINTLKDADLTGKTIAFFGCGDAESYSDTFCDAMGLIYKEIKDSGCQLIGQVDSADYSFDASASVTEGKFIGLAIDDVNQADQTDSRIENWVNSLKTQL